MKHCVFALCICLSPCSLFLPLHSSPYVEKKKRRVKCIARVKALTWPDCSPARYQPGGMQVSPAPHGDLDLGYSPIVLSYHLPCERNPLTYWKSSLIFRVSEQSKVGFEPKKNA